MNFFKKLLVFLILATCLCLPLIIRVPNMDLVFIILTVVFLFLYLATDKMKYLDRGLFLGFIPLLIIFNILASFTIYIIYIFNHGSITVDDKLENIYYLCMLIYEVSIYAFLIGFFYWKDYSRHFRVFIKKIKQFATYFLIYFFLFIFLATIFGMLASLIPVSESVPANEQSVDSVLSAQVFFNFYVIIVVIVGPIVEEFTFRYLLIERIFFRIINPRYLSLFQVFYITSISALIFAFMHAQNADSLIYFARDMLIYLPFSITLSLAYINHRNIYLTTTLHMFNNLIATAGLILIKI